MLHNRQVMKVFICAIFLCTVKVQVYGTDKIQEQIIQPEVVEETIVFKEAEEIKETETVEVENDIIETNSEQELNQVDENVEKELTEEEKRQALIAHVKNLVKPSVVYGKIKWNVGAFKKGEVVEIVEDRGNGKTYRVRLYNRVGWISGNAVHIDPKDYSTNPHRMTNEEFELFINNSDFSSKTKYFVWVDLDRQLTHVLMGSKGQWKIVKTIICSTGKNITSTKRGTFTIKERGREFGTAVRGRNWVRYDGSYLFHSVPVNPSGKIIDNTLGARASDGCVRMSMEDSKWFYDTIPRGTTVRIY